MYSFCLEEKMSRGSTLMISVVFVLILSVNGQQLRNNDVDMCGDVVDVLCVKDVLSEVAEAAIKIQEMASKMEHKIVSMIFINLFLNNFLIDFSGKKIQMKILFVIIPTL
jgi:hypothetical protein